MARRALPAWARAALAAGVAAATLVMVGLGVWQLDRRQQRLAEVEVIRARLAQPPVDLNAEPAAALDEYRRVHARGTFDFAEEIVLRNRAYRDAPGAHVLTPLLLSGSGQAVLVDRGWIPYTETAPEQRAPHQVPTGEVVVEGIVRPSQQRPYAFLPADPTQSPEQPRLDAWFWVNLPQIERQLPYALLPYYIEAGPDDTPQALPYSGYTVDLSAGSHLGYAIQWFAFAAILAGGSLGLWWQARANQKRPPEGGRL